ncbi:MAG: anti-sigma factor antagonist [Candidatus Schekmanbacteria bacterium]|nr:anti-sigma factor antagonist [Candidatus Schekmanbacteria bacterium]
MGFNLSYELDTDLVKVVLRGELDGQTAIKSQKTFEEAAKLKPDKVVVYMKDLNYMSSAGIRLLLYIKQRVMSKSSQMILVAPQATVLNTLTMSGVTQAVHVVDAY